MQDYSISHAPVVMQPMATTHKGVDLLQGNMQVQLLLSIVNEMKLHFDKNAQSQARKIKKQHFLLVHD